MGDFIDLQGNVALVTGGAQGIGKSIVGLLADCGASVVVSDINRETAEKTVAELTAQGKKAMPVQANVARGEEVKAMVDSVVSQWGKIDILVNNAGITRDTLLLRMKDEDWDAVLSVNLKGTYHCMKAVLSSMSKQRRGRIINISSIVGVIGNAGQANYAASKAAVIGLTKTVAREYAGRGITVNAVAPGFIDTAMTAVLSAEVKENLMKQIPLARLGSPLDIANAVVFLASDRAGYMTGQVLHVNGGMYMGG
ncbi:3-oxoacyl-[acyl-carrier-protein] reductase [Candidatus Manganitrophus noduliformans]|uniref:3-oxoacyl-[acyl-carrier-protein] reductase n=1 Tax=Candidatus Manganitrophus noduliformans TaxID=2606439 RepID=A0A7X6IAF1_9BACT|nr:3-oxoacyl-[acyl-carrier-protein] reductase [Candidatus Manganitrophus noduliformans]NKE70345.1 3-oxoacyl-[acyl-carrier-protein] reductase [Candidatus Manganitrophus noduliformans]